MITDNIDFIIFWHIYKPASYQIYKIYSFPGSLVTLGVIKIDGALFIF